MFQSTTRAAFLYCVACLPLFAICQDTVWKRIDINRDISVRLPGKIDSMNVTEGSNIVHVSFGKWHSDVYMVESFDTRINAEPESEVFRGFHEGFVEKMKEKHFVCTSADTMIQKIPMKSVTSIGATGNKPIVWHSYLFILNTRFYNVAAIYSNPDTSDLKELHYFLSSLTLVQRNQSKYVSMSAFKDGYAIGYALGILLVIGGIGYLIYFLVKKSSR